MKKLVGVCFWSLPTYTHNLDKQRSSSMGMHACMHALGQATIRSSMGLRLVPFLCREASFADTRDVLWEWGSALYADTPKERSSRVRLTGRHFLIPRKAALYMVLRMVRFRVKLGSTKGATDVMEIQGADSLVQQLVRLAMASRGRGSSGFRGWRHRRAANCKIN